MMDQHNQPTAQEWSQCPFCKSQDIEGNSVEVEGLESWQQMSCSRCQGTWAEVYEAVYRINLEPGADVTDTAYALAMIDIESDLDGNVVGLTVIPSEGNPGYDGPRLPGETWRAVAKFLGEHTVGDDLYALRWEG